MRRRKKWIAAFVVLAASLAVFYLWPRDNVEARRLLDELCTLIEADQQSEWPAPAAAKFNGDGQIELELLVAKINMTDAKRGLFAASPTASSARAVRVKSRQRFADLLQQLRSAEVATIISEPRIAVQSGRPASIASASQVPVPINLPGAGMGLAYKNVGITVAFTTQAAPNGRVHVEVDCETSCITGKQAIATAQGAVEQPLFDVRRFAATFIIGDNETILIGGLTQKGAMPVTLKAPLLADLQGIGPWFCLSWQRPIDEELIVLVTPRIVSPQDWRRMIPEPAASSRPKPAGLVR